ncbi:hypothetical protein QCA50_008161 [Cerrena zonata]|uniref:Uncharacterized protein n=1 Tax=Cerrena zonata TaxID=2478898 RepID=A0AAW0GEU3_9APHY
MQEQKKHNVNNTIQGPRTENVDAQTIRTSHFSLPALKKNKKLTDHSCSNNLTRICQYSIQKSLLDILAATSPSISLKAHMPLIHLTRSNPRITGTSSQYPPSVGFQIQLGGLLDSLNHPLIRWLVVKVDGHYLC